MARFRVTGVSAPTRHICTDGKYREIGQSELGEVLTSENDKEKSVVRDVDKIGEIQ